MKLFYLALILLILVNSSIQDENTSTSNKWQEKWAVLVAGSSGYSNYRHQADVCHAYHTLITKGVEASHIIVFAYDDIAYHVSNPIQGKIFNKPAAGVGNDVYNGCVIDYSGNDITPANYINVITGNATAMTGIGSGRVLESTSADNVFIYFSDHGGYGLIAFPNQHLYQDDFQNALLTMYNQSMFHELVYYLEACESGSMFLDFPTDKNIYALTASNPTQSSYATYCSSTDTVNGVDLNTCLGDLFSVSFLEDTDASNTQLKTLQQQFVTVAALTTSSEVQQYGQLNITGRKIGKFFGEKITFQFQIPLLYRFFLWLSIWDERLVRLQTLYRLWQHQLRINNDNCYELEFYEEASHITRITLMFQNITTHLGLSLEDCDRQRIKITSHACVKRLVKFFEDNCTKFGEYGLKFVYYIVHLCENDRKFQTFEAKSQFLSDSCQVQEISFKDLSIDYAVLQQGDDDDSSDSSQGGSTGGNNRLLADYMNYLRGRY